MPVPRTTKVESGSGLAKRKAPTNDLPDKNKVTGSSRIVEMEELGLRFHIPAGYAVDENFSGNEFPYGDARIHHTIVFNSLSGPPSVDEIDAMFRDPNKGAVTLYSITTYNREYVVSQQRKWEESCAQHPGGFHCSQEYLGVVEEFDEIRRAWQTKKSASAIEEDERRVRYEPAEFAGRTFLVATVPTLQNLAFNRTATTFFDDIRLQISIFVQNFHENPIFFEQAESMLSQIQIEQVSQN